MRIVAIVAAGGRGTRLGAGVPKQLLTIGGESILRRSVRLFAEHPRIDEVVVVLPPDLAGDVPADLDLPGKPVRVVAGGARRQDSVRHGFDAVRGRADIVVIHDAARPFASAGLISRTIDAALESGAALAALAASDTVKLTSGAPGAEPFVVERTVPRERVFLIAAIGAYLFPFTAVDYIDRYLLFVLPFLFVLWAQTWPASRSAPVALRRGAAMVWILACVGLGAAATHDYFAWNRARWDAIRLAESLGATPDTLDGGFEYNGFHRFERKPRDETAGKSPWWVKDDQYIVAFVPVPGYEEVGTFPVRRWLPRTPPVVRLLRRR